MVLFFSYLEEHFNGCANGEYLEYDGDCVQQHHECENANDKHCAKQRHWGVDVYDDHLHGYGDVRG